MRHFLKALSLPVLGSVAALVWGLSQEKSRDLIMTPAPSAAIKAGSGYEHSYALVIGIDHYSNLKDKDLNFAVADAKEIARTLHEDYGFQIIPLYDKDATLKNIRARLRSLADPKKVNRDDRVLIYFSGHGQSITVGRRDVAYLIPSDARLTVEANPNWVEYSKSCLSDTEFNQDMGKIPAKHVAVIADACFSGRLASTELPGSGGSRSILEDAAPSLMKLRAHEVLAACGKGQVAQEWDGHGIFTAELLKELERRKKSNEKFSLMNLWSDLQPSVAAAVAKAKKNPQVPQYSRLDSEGAFLLYKKAPDPVVMPYGPLDAQGTQEPSEKPASPAGFSPVATCMTEGPVANITFSPDRSEIAVTGFDGSLSLCGVQKGTLLRQIDPEPDTLVRISPNWKMIFTFRIERHGGETVGWLGATDRSGKQDYGGEAISMPAGAVVEDMVATDNGVVICGAWTKDGEQPGQQGYYTVWQPPGRPQIHMGLPPLRKAAISADGLIVALFGEPTSATRPAQVYLTDAGSPKTTKIDMPWSMVTDLAVTRDSKKGFLLAVTCADRNEDESVLVKGTLVYAIPQDFLAEKAEATYKTGYQFMHVTGLTAGGRQIFGWSEAMGGTYVLRSDLASRKDVESPGSPMWPDATGAWVATADPDGQVTIYRKAG